MDNGKRDLIKQYNRYVNQYNRASNSKKLEITNQLYVRQNIRRSKLQTIKKRMASNGFTPEEAREIKKAFLDRNQQQINAHKKDIQNFINANNFSKEDFEGLWKQVDTDQVLFDKTLAEYHIIRIILEEAETRDYPPRLELYEELSKGEQEKIIRNAAAKEWVDRGDEIDENYNEKIKSEARKLLNEKGGDWCITGGGNATKQFYETVYRKLKPVRNSHKTVKPPSESTVKNRVNELLKRDNL